MTYNVLADPLRVRERIPPLLSLIAAQDADVIGLQEVAPWFLGLLHDQPWAADYRESMIAGRRAAPGGQYLLSRHPITSCWAVTLPGRQHRTALFANIDIGGTALRVATTHMESFLEDGPVRARQLSQIFGELVSAEHALLLGDLNFGDGEPESASLDPAYEDVWLKLRPGDAGFTWNIEKSELARRSSFVGEPSRRLDRVLLRSRLWKGTRISIIGDHPVVPDRTDLFPSDHFGLVADLDTTG